MGRIGLRPSDSVRKMTAQEMPYPYQEKLETTGNEWTEESDDLKLMFPKLYAKYVDNV